MYQKVSAPLAGSKTHVQIIEYPQRRADAGEKQNPKAETDRSGAGDCPKVYKSRTESHTE